MGQKKTSKVEYLVDTVEEAGEEDWKELKRDRFQKELDKYLMTKSNEQVSSFKEENKGENHTKNSRSILDQA